MVVAVSLGIQQALGHAILNNPHGEITEIIRDRYDSRSILQSSVGQKRSF